MGLISFAVTSLVASALAYLGNQQNQEAKKRNHCSKLIVDACNEYIDRAQQTIDDRRKKMEEFLETVGMIKKSSVDVLFTMYLDALDTKFVNFDVDDEVEGTFEYKKELKTIDEMKNMVHQIKKSEIEFDSNNYENNSLAVSLAILGISTVASSVVSTVMSNLFFGTTAFTLLHAIPISIGAGFVITGIINNYKSKQTYEDALEFYEKTKKFSEQVVALCDSYDKLLVYVAYIGKNLKSITGTFADFLCTFDELIYENGGYDGSTIDVRKLSKDERKLVKDTYILSQIVYASYDLPLFSKDGDINEETSNELIENVNNANELIWRYDA